MVPAPDAALASDPVACKGGTGGADHHEELSPGHPFASLRPQGPRFGNRRTTRFLASTVPFPEVRVNRVGLRGCRLELGHRREH